MRNVIMCFVSACIGGVITAFILKPSPSVQPQNIQNQVEHTRVQQPRTDRHQQVSPNQTEALASDEYAKELTLQKDDIVVEIDGADASSPEMVELLSNSDHDIRVKIKRHGQILTGVIKPSSENTKM